MDMRLSPNGIDKLMGSVGGIVVQLISLAEKFQNNQYYYLCELSDGYARVKGCVMDSAERVEKGRLTDCAVIKVTKSALQKDKKQRLIVFVEGFELIAEPKTTIGSPIPFDEYQKNGKNNPDGDNLIPPQKPAKVEKMGAKVQSKAIRQQRGNSSQFEQSKTNDENSRLNKNPPSKNPPKNNGSNPPNKPNQSNNSNMSNSNQSKLQLTPPPQKNNQNSLPKEESRAVSRQQQKPKQNGPIQKLPYKEQRHSQSIAGKQRKPNSEYTQIRSLYVGMDNWTVLCRVIAIYPLKPIITKKGTESFMFTFEIGDKSGLIDVTVFGETAQRFEGSLKQDQVYQISNGSVSENSFMGSHKLKIMINEQSRVNLKEDDPSVPYMEDFCISIKTLLNTPIGEQVRVICLVKDEGEVTPLVSKEGKQLRKKSILLCDPIDKVEVQITLWNESVELKFQRYPYMIKGVFVKEYQGNRQYTLRSNHRAILLKQHPLRKYIKDIENIAFINPDSNKKNNKKTSISNFQDLNNAMDQVTPSGTWSEVVCFIAAIKHSGKNFYIGCPKCKKKVAEVKGAACVHCGTIYEQAQHRYVLSLSVADYYDSIWVNAYDEAGEALLGMPAQTFADLKEEEVTELLKRVRYRHKKLRLVTKNEEFSGTIRKKTTIIKVIDLNYAEETKTLLDRVRQFAAK